MSKSGNLPYWEKQFPELIAKLTEYQKSLLDTQAPGDFIALTEGQVKSRIRLLDEAKTLEERGEGEKSRLYKKEMTKVQDIASHNLLISCIGHVASWSLMLIPATQAINSHSQGDNTGATWWLGALGLGLYAVTLIGWGSAKTIRSLTKREVEATGKKPSKKELRRSIRSLRIVNTMLAYAPVIALTALLVGFCYLGIAGPGGLITGVSGAMVLIVDLLILWIVGKD